MAPPHLGPALAANAHSSPWLAEDLAVRALVGLLFPLLLIAGVRLIHLGLRSTRRRYRRHVEQSERWLAGAGIGRGGRTATRRWSSGVWRVGELALQLAFAYAFSSYYLLLFPETRELGTGLLATIWPPLREALFLAFTALTYLAFGVIVWAAARWAITRLRERLGDEVARPATPLERERLIALRALVGMVGFFGVVVVVAVLPGPGQLVGGGLVLVLAATVLLGLRRTLENVAAGFVAGRIVCSPRGTPIRIGELAGVVEEWTATCLRLRTDAGEAIVPYRLLEEEPVFLTAPGPERLEAEPTIATSELGGENAGGAG
jgi:hypothetical protein